MDDRSAVANFAEAVGRSLIDAENAFVDGYAIDDNEHIPRLRRIAETVGATARAAGIGDRDAAAITRKLLEHAEQEYMKRWMSDLYDDEDPDEVREEGLGVFRHVLRGGRR